jgi:hypothetical protein
MRFAKLGFLARTPRPISSELEQITGKPFFFLPWAVKSWQKQMQGAPLVEAAIVQANGALYARETACFAPAVVCFWLDQRALDGRSAAALAAHLQAIRDERAPDPSGGRIHARLNDDEGHFYEALPAAIGSGAFWTTTYVDPGRLPGGCLPEDGVLPALADPAREYFQLVPSSLWA